MIDAFANTARILFLLLLILANDFLLPEVYFTLTFLSTNTTGQRFLESFFGES